ncbi:MAG: protoporphyrinogen oxidase [Myxococcota bacterium]
MTHVGIVGGGPSGLAVAEALGRRGLRTTVLEADDRVGGKVGSDIQEGFVLEHGPHGFLGRVPAVFELIDRLGLTDQLIEADESSARRYLVRAGRLVQVPEGPGDLMSSSILSWPGKLRLMTEPLWPPEGPRDESVHDFAVRRLGPEAAEVMVDAIVTGIYGGDPSRLSLPSAFPRMHELESEYGSLIRAQFALAKSNRDLSPEEKRRRKSLHSFKGGLQQLVDGLARASGPILTQHEVRRMVPTDEGWRVEGSFGQLDFDGLVLAAPAFVAGALLGPLSDQAGRAAEAVAHAPISVVMQAFPAQALRRRPEGFGFLAPHRENRELLGCIWASSVFPDHAPHGLVSFRTLHGGARRPELAEGSDDALIARSRGELEALAGVDPEARPILTKVVRWPRGIPQYEQGHGERVRAMDQLERQHPGLFVVGSGFRGVALLDCLEEGERAAERISRWCSPS